ncbi:TrkA C-terminal domain-containing protein [Microbulbifer sp. SAOS-129_SWC]|uniref:cation:proton antiporter regulatory subunit n=1 Tax=Microbulbifer sp. SAOS-129_SWC TaxID=3145235 RepID=UPI00321690C3
MAGAVIEYIAAQVDFPEIDVRQRLTVSRGYGVGEIYVPEGSRFVGRAIADIRTDEHDINVLTLYRGRKVIPNPKATRVLEANDKLLCFGRLEVMRDMIPAKTRRRRQPDIGNLPADAVSAADTVPEVDQ